MERVETRLGGNCELTTRTAAVFRKCDINISRLDEIPNELINIKPQMYYPAGRWLLSHSRLQSVAIAQKVLKVKNIEMQLSKK